MAARWQVGWRCARRLVSDRWTRRHTVRKPGGIAHVASDVPWSREVRRGVLGRVNKQLTSGSKCSAAMCGVGNSGECGRSPVRGSRQGPARHIRPRRQRRSRAPLALGPMSAPLRLLSVHAHPDDESSKGAPTVAKYVARASRPRWSAAPAARRVTSSTRRWTDRRSARTSPRYGWRNWRSPRGSSGTTTVDMLGYHDSGMPDTETNARADNFANAPLDEADRAPRRHHPPGPPAGDPHLQRRAGRLQPSRSRAGARDLGPRLRPRRRPGLVPRCRRAVGTAEDVLLGLVTEADAGPAREVPGARHGVAVRRGVVQALGGSRRRTT